MSDGVLEFVGESCAAEAHQSGWLARDGAFGMEEFADVLKALEVTDAHRVIPLGFADGEQGFAVGVPVVTVAEDGDVDLMAGFEWAGARSAHVEPGGYAWTCSAGRRHGLSVTPWATVCRLACALLPGFSVTEGESGPCRFAGSPMRWPEESSRVTPG
nr:hypothetical protein [Streptomyces albicerus]